MRNKADQIEFRKGAKEKFSKAGVTQFGVTDAMGLTGGTDVNDFYKEFANFAAQASEAGLSMSANSGEDQFKDLYVDMYGSESGWDTFWSQISNLGTSFDELATEANAVTLAERQRTDATMS
jgi:hypothetical protein